MRNPLPAAQGRAPLGLAVIGLGNWLRGDDAAGLAIARRLPGDEGLSVADYEGEAIGLLDLWADRGAVVLIDAVRSGVPAGTIHRVDASRRPLRVALMGGSSHTVGAGEAVELARAIGRLPRTVVFYGVEGSTFALGAALSPAVGAVISPTAQRVLAEARALKSVTCR